MTREPWTPEDDALLAQTYPSGIGVAYAAFQGRRTRVALITRAKQKQIKVKEEVRAKGRKRAAMRALKTVMAKQAERKPFDDVPREYIKVSSIFRVGQRYEAQEQAA